MISGIIKVLIFMLISVQVLKAQTFRNDFYKFEKVYFLENFFTQKGIDSTGSIENEKAPWDAVWRSAVLPGWGQYYNESYWKIPIVLGVFGWFVYNWKINNDYYVDYKDRYNESVNSGKENTNFKLYRDFYRDERDLFAIYISLAYFLNLIDAYVDAQLFHFDIYTKKNNLLINFKINL